MALHQMVSLALPDEGNTGHDDHPSEPKFGFGTSLHFSTEHVKALFGDQMPEVGKKFAINGMAFVDSASMNIEDDGEKRMSIGLQLTSIEMLPPTEEKKGRTLDFDKTQSEV